ncbi:hypothetical protein GF358_00740 [Candidatus Woesearchaeota archaeon]|nr:hypothetical protein [Candidatus Woesearchaeota archaeon]
MKAQVTFFMILGLIILVAFALVVYIASFKEMKESVQQVPEQVFKRTVVDSVREYARDCVASVSEQALVFLGRQGGRLYKSQASIIDNPVEFIEYNGFNVSYSIVPPEGTVGPYTSEIPEYPWDGFPWIVKENEEIAWFYGYFGLPDFPPLYDFSKKSVQEMIEIYVENNVVGCFDESRFPGVSFEIKKPSVRMIIARNISQLSTEEFVSFGVEWPIKVIDSDGSVAELRKFVVNYPVSFGRVYYHAKNLVDSDVSDVFFNPGEYPGYDIEIVENVKNNDDIIILTDRKSRLIGKPFSFYLARKNRAPALVEINRSVSENTFCLGTKFSIDNNFLRASSSQLNYKLSAFDPDEDQVSFHLSPARPELYKSTMILRVIARDGGGLEDYQDIKIFGETCE